jgi:hypothetical protein
MKTFLGFMTGLLGGGILGIAFTASLAYNMPEFREAFIKMTNPDNTEKSERSDDYAVEVENLNN